MTQIDQTDIQILNHLNRNCRITKNHLAQLVHLTPPAVAARIAQLEDSGVIRKYTIEVDPEKLGYTHQVFIQIQLAHFNHQDYHAFIHQKRNFIRHHYKISGQMNEMLQAAFHSSAELNAFLVELEAYANYQVLEIIDELI